MEFINGLLACDVQRPPNMGYSRVESVFGTQRTSLEVIHAVQSKLTETVRQGGFGFDSESMLYLGAARMNTIAIPWGKLERIDFSSSKDVELRCSPSNSSCLSITAKKVERSFYRLKGHGTHDGVDGTCEGDAVVCAQHAYNDLNNKHATQGNLNSYTINFCREEDTARSVKAINHLIQMNGGKKSLF